MCQLRLRYATKCKGPLLTSVGVLLLCWDVFPSDFSPMSDSLEMEFTNSNISNFSWDGNWTGFSSSSLFDSPFNCDFTRLLFIVAYSGVFCVCFFGKYIRCISYEGIKKCNLI